MSRILRHRFGLSTRPRGQTLLLAMIVVAVLAILGTTALVYTGQGLSSARQFQKRESLSACGTAARGWILSQIRPGAEASAALKAFSGQVDAGRFILRTGHITDAAPTAAVTGVAGMGGEAYHQMNLSNRMVAGDGKGGVGTAKSYRAVVTCIEKETGTATEVEFAVRLML